MGVVAVYCRISKDRDGRAEGVAVQETRGRNLAARQWPDLAVTVWVDNDLYAADPDTHRPGYAAMVDAIRRGEVEQVVCAEQSRLTRQPAEWEELTVTLTRAGIATVHGYRTGPVQVSGSRLVGRILAAVDAEEVERLRARVTDRLDALAAEGRPSGGRAYGYRSTVDDEGRKARVQVPNEASVLHDMAQRVLAGASLTSIARNLNDEGVAAARGGRWSSTSVRSVLRSPTVAGIRVHRGETVGTGTWPAILDEVTWRRVRAAMVGTRTVQRSDGGTYEVTGRRQPARRYLLTGGIARCGLCGAELVAQQRRGRNGDRAPAYLCHPVRGGCSRIGVLAEPFEAHVADRFLAGLVTYRASTVDDGRAGLVVEQADVDARRAEVARLFAAGDLSGDEWAAARSGLGRRADDLARRLAVVPARVDADGVAALWPHMALPERRQVIGALIGRVAVHPARPGARAFDPERVTVEWR